MDKKINHIINISKKFRHVTERMNELAKNGYTVKKCYVQSTKLYSVIKMSRSQETRIVIGRPSPHLCKEVYCVIL